MTKPRDLPREAFDIPGANVVDFERERLKRLAAPNYDDVSALADLWQRDRTQALRWADMNLNLWEAGNE